MTTDSAFGVNCDLNYIWVSYRLNEKQRNTYNTSAAINDKVIPGLARVYMHGMQGTDRMYQRYGYCMNSLRSIKYWFAIYGTQHVLNNIY